MNKPQAQADLPDAAKPPAGPDRPPGGTDSRGRRGGPHPLLDNPRFRNWLAVGKVTALWHRRISAALVPFDLKLPHYDILANLYREPNMSQQRLAEKMLVGRSNLSMLLPDLEARGLILRSDDPVDKRLRRVALTAQGLKVTEAALAVHARLIEDMMDVLSQEECDQIGALMRRLAERLEADPA